MRDLWRRKLKAFAIFFFLIVGFTGSSAQSLDGDCDAIGRLLGNYSPEDMDPVEVERLEELMLKPLKINVSGTSELLESGLFSEYQIASLEDYRDNHGNVLSITELGAIDGFGQDFALRVSPFVSFSGAYNMEKRFLRTEWKVRSGLSYSFGGDLRWSVGSRIFCEISDRVSFSLSYSKPFSGKPVPESVGANVVVDFRKAPLKLIFGDFNIRFGQGLALWNGMGMNGVTSPASFVKRPSGISPASSFSSDYSFLGVGAQCSLSFFRASVGVVMPQIRKVRFKIDECGYMPFADLSYLFKNGMLSLSGFAEFRPFSKDNATPSVTGRVSLSQRWTFRGCELFSEAVFDCKAFVPAVLSGMSLFPSESVRLAAIVRYYPKDYPSEYCAAVRSRSSTRNEHSVSFAGEYSVGDLLSFGNALSPTTVRRHSGIFYMDLSHIPRPVAGKDLSGFQLKTGFDWNYVINGNFALKMKFAQRFRDWDTKGNVIDKAESVFSGFLQSQFRTDFQLCVNRFLVNLRCNFVHCKDFGFLGYVEGAYKIDRLSLYLRNGVFLIDNWDDRIYVYERDAPGAFNVPAFYGRGLWCAFTGVWKFSKWGRMYLRMAFTSYPFSDQEKKKPGKAELKLQFNVRL